jgi:hypothetical protein
VLFKANGMQAFSNFSRLAAWATSKYFVRNLVNGTHPDRVRYLKELGFTDEDINTGLPAWVGSGMREYKEGMGYDTIEYRAMLARQRFVQESAFAPDAGQRPLIASHPYAMLFYHLKQYAFSFYSQILAPLAREVAKNPRMAGKLAAVAPLALLFPLAMLGMSIRDELKHGLWRDSTAHDARL